VKELSLHILDLAENSLRAGASFLDITIVRDLSADTLTITLVDNGPGMSPVEVARATDPFYSTKKTRRTGLGIPLMAQAAERAGGSFCIASQQGSGTRVKAVFQDSHIDRQPLGDVAGMAIAVLLAGPEIDLRLVCCCGLQQFILDTRELRGQLDGLPLNHIEVLSILRDNIEIGIAGLAS
jgi:anti-sigma regulatory factor (Ser/Thr protein kinase)